MTDLPNRPVAKDLTRLERLAFAIPLLGWMLKDVAYGDADNIYHFIFALACAWAIAILFFGYPAVIIPALVATPTVFVALVLISRG